MCLMDNPRERNKMLKGNYKGKEVIIDVYFNHDQLIVEMPDQSLSDGLFAPYILISGNCYAHNVRKQPDTVIAWVTESAKQSGVAISGDALAKEITAAMVASY